MPCLARIMKRRSRTGLEGLDMLRNYSQGYCWLIFDTVSHKSSGREGKQDPSLQAQP